MDALSEIQQYLANPELKISREKLDEIQQACPYFTLPLLLYLKQNGIEGNDELLGKLAISIPDRKALALQLGVGSEAFSKFYPEEEVEQASTTHAIDMFLDAFGSGSDKEVEVLENMIFNPTPDYADILAASDDTPLGTDNLSEQDALIHSFIADQREKESQVAALPQQHVDEEEAAEIADAPISQPADNDPSMLSESLAKTYIQRRNYSKALEIIESINLNFPEKSIYFADQIRFLRKLVLNEKTKQ